MSGRCLHPMILLLQLCRCYAESLLSQSGTPSSNVETLLHKYQLYLYNACLSVSDCAAISTILQSHRQTENLHKVDIAGCSIQDVGLSQILSGLQRCKSIKSVNMGRNSLSSQHMSAVSGVLANNASTLTEFQLAYNFESGISAWRSSPRVSSGAGS